MICVLVRKINLGIQRKDHVRTPQEEAIYKTKRGIRDFPGGPRVKNPP